jgi:hypothetical protein
MNALKGRTLGFFHPQVCQKVFDVYIQNSGKEPSESE